MNKISSEKRSKIMSAIKSKNTKLEIKFRKELWKNGFRYRIHHKIIGKPDIVFLRQKIAVFIDGDFWHGYDFENLKPKLKNKFWLDKISNNIERDKKINAELKKEGWQIIRFWEHEINNNIERCINTLKKKLI